MRVVIAAVMFSGHDMRGAGLPIRLLYERANGVRLPAGGSEYNEMTKPGHY
jgi:hypothetical protein